MALSTISPTLSETFGVLVNLAVVSNVVPYIISLSALMVMMQKAKTPQAAYRRNVVVVTVALLYSVYAIYASGASAVLGGMIVMGIGYVIYGFIAPRFEVKAAAALFLPAGGARRRSRRRLRPERWSRSSRAGRSASATSSGRGRSRTSTRPGSPPATQSFSVRRSRRRCTRSRSSSSSAPRSGSPP